ncbi:MAG: hypothetical protein R3C44_04130 [Chloroflexota bacterium]
MPLVVVYRLLIGAFFLASPDVFSRFLDPLAPGDLHCCSAVDDVVCLYCVDHFIQSDRPARRQALSTGVVAAVILVVIGQSLGLVLVNKQTILFIGGIVLVLDAVH